MWSSDGMQHSMPAAFADGMQHSMPSMAPAAFGGAHYNSSTSVDPSSPAFFGVVNTGAMRSSTGAGVDAFGVGLTEEQKMYMQSAYGYDYSMMGMSGGGAGGQPDSNPIKLGAFGRVSMYPPNPNDVVEKPRTARPPGCKTIFVGGLPSKADESMIRDVFSTCGAVQSVHMRIERHFAHVRFSSPESVDSAVLLSGYDLCIDGQREHGVTHGKLYVDFSESRKDQQDYEAAKNASSADRDRSLPDAEPKIETYRYSERRASDLLDMLKTPETLLPALSKLHRWFEQNECTKTTSSTFYNLLNTANFHVRRVHEEKTQLAADMKVYREQFVVRMQGVGTVLKTIDDVINCAKKQRNWEHFSKAQRKNIENWLRLISSCMTDQNAEVIREVDICKGIVGSGVFDEPESKRTKVQDMAIDSDDGEMEEENGKLKKQITKLKQQLMKARVDKTLSMSAAEGQSAEGDSAMNQMRVALTECQAQLVESGVTIQSKTEEIKQLRSRLESLEPLEVSSSTGNAASSTSASNTDAELACMISVFLNVHPFGANVEYITSYVSCTKRSITIDTVERTLKSFPQLFSLVVTGIGAGLERRWKFVGLSSSDVVGSSS